MNDPETAGLVGVDHELNNAVIIKSERIRFEDMISAKATEHLAGIYKD